MSKTIVFSRIAAVLLLVWLSVGMAVGQEKGKSEADAGAKKKPLPLVATRKIEFTTEEGTWMTVDISPDSRTLIFDLLGDIYSFPVTGGAAKPLVDGLGFASQPTYSPDGQTIAFISDRGGSNNLWIASKDGSNPQQLSKEKQAEFASPVWTPDGESVAVSKASPATRGAFEMWVYHRLGGSGLKISKGGPGPTAQADTPRPSDLGPFIFRNYLFYARQAPRTGSRFLIPETQLTRRDLTSGDEDGITFLPGNAFRPVVSPNGDLLVFGSRYEGKTGLRIRDLKTGDERWLKFPIQRDELESRPTRGLLPGYSFSPDGSSVFIAYGGKIRRIDVKDGAVTEIPFSAKVSLDTGPSLYRDFKIEEGPVRARLIQEPEISPSGKITFSALAAVYTLEPESKEPVRLTSVPDPREYQPSWSPDGKSVVFVSWSTKGGHVWLAEPENGTPRRISNRAAFYRDPVFTPDGRFIVCLRTTRQTRVNHPSDFLGPQPGLDIVKIPVSGGDAETIVPARGLGRPHFGPESDRVYVYGNRGLISYRFDG
ncbi:MAG: amidohydrolase, partial [Acidobacteriota bacterium]|nr:amidohydrolase [Acidobacteriota bacterium]